MNDEFIFPQLEGPPDELGATGRKTAAGKLLQKIAKGAVKVGAAPLRNAWLLAMKLNVLGIAEKLRFGYFSQSVAASYGYNASKWNIIRQQLRKAETSFIKAGGKAENLKNAIMRGKGNARKPVAINSLDGLAGAEAIPNILAPILQVLQIMSAVLAAIHPGNTPAPEGQEQAEPQPEAQPKPKPAPTPASAQPRPQVTQQKLSEQYKRWLIWLNLEDNGEARRQFKQFTAELKSLPKEDRAYYVSAYKKAILEETGQTGEAEKLSGIDKDIMSAGEIALPGVAGLTTFRYPVFFDPANDGSARVDGPFNGLAPTELPFLPAISDPSEENSRGWSALQSKYNDRMLDSIRQQFGAIIDRVSSLLQLPESLLVSFIHTESMGDYRAGFYKGTFTPPGFPSSVRAIRTVRTYKGLMQISADSATSGIIKARKAGLLSADVMAYLNRIFGEPRISAIRRYANESPQYWDRNRIRDNDLLDPEKNIILGALYLKSLLEQYNGRLDMAIVAYNAGPGTMNNIRKRLGNNAAIMAIYRQAPPESKGYILKMLGERGTLTSLAA